MTSGEFLPYHPKPYVERPYRISKVSLEGGEMLRRQLGAELEYAGLAQDPMIQWSLKTAELLHANQRRTSGMHMDHVVRTTLRVVGHYRVTDPDVVGASLLHDTIEDHPKDTIRMSGEEPDDTNNHDDALAALESQPLINKRVLDLVNRLSTPPVDGTDKSEAYVRHIKKRIMPDPAARIIKLADFMDNAVGNHYTSEPLRSRLDAKYLPLYDIHAEGVMTEDSLVPQDIRLAVLAKLSEGRQNAIDRLSGIAPSPATGPTAV